MTFLNYPQKQSKANLGILTVFRIGLFNLGLGLMSVLTLAILNRVMISELGIPGTITAGTIAMSQLVAPARVWFGRLSDVKPIFGLHRSNYVRFGTIFSGLAVFTAIQIVWRLGKIITDNGGWVWNDATIALVVLLGLILAIYGLALSSSSTPFTALLVDISQENNRSQIVAIVWSMLMVGIVIGGISGSILLRNLGTSTQNPLEVLQPPINSIFKIAPLVVFALAMIATWKVEKKYSHFNQRTEAKSREDGVGVKSAFKILTASRQTGIFFSFLVMITIGLFMQEAVLEPYGGEVFGMSIAQSTLLNSFWGVGILIGYSLTGFLIIPRLGKITTNKIGCILVAICFGLIILSGFTQEQMILKITMVIFGIATGITTVSSINLMLDLTSATSAGTFIGAWGLAQSLSRAIATVSGGIVLDVGRQIFTTPVLAYGLVFALQALAMLMAILILNQINVAEFKTNNSEATTLVMEGDLDS
ncbi:BCD family MFS transporter [Gloeocapsa sp. PCC 73106]|uniref:BCD family MFS transporter n=1 Tax=Gloeocapsa sp. PCC 73106 TaxID=102232 RepID=UPI0002AC8A9D|nr:BCD family MFS transporter [Gloeocapsa sp. PCC 73106]ELR99471.1 PUCC protein [Gloeocapsa sp. PCC 73106]